MFRVVRMADLSQRMGHKGDGDKRIDWRMGSRHRRLETTQDCEKVEE